MKLLQEMIALSRQNEEHMLELRRQLHRCPELGYQEEKTAGIIRAELDRLQIPYRTVGTGTIAELGTGTGKRVALRADIDALPITEETGLDFRSLHPGQMHACGHDCHTAMLLNTAHILAALQNELPGPVRLIFQPAEEGGCGALPMIRNGVLENVSSIYCLHMKPGIGAGVFATRAGLIHASSDGFLIRIHGSKCHGSEPEKGVDAIVIASHTVLALQEIISREIGVHDPAVLTVGKIHGGEARNIVCDEVMLECTLRTLNEEIRQYVHRRISEIAAGTAAMYRGAAETEWLQCYCSCRNDERETDFAVTLAEEMFEGQPVVRLEKAGMDGEDFGFYQQIVPGVKLFIGTGCREGLHTSGFRVDESGLYRGAAFMAAVAMNRYFSD